MKVVDCPESSDVMTFNDKVMGVFERQQDLDSYLDSIEATGEAEILSGESGVRCLKNVKKSVEGFLDAVLGDMESAMLKVYLQAVERGAVVFAVPCDSESRDGIVNLAVSHGARHIAHFGQVVNESFEHLTGDMPP